MLAETGVLAVYKFSEAVLYMKTRIISGILGSALVALILILGQFVPVLYNLLVSVVSFVCVFEILTASGMTKKLQVFLPSAAYALLLPVLLSTPYWQIAAIAYPLTMFVLMFIFTEKVKFSDVAFAMVTTEIITLGMGSIIVVCDRNRRFALFYIMLSLLIPWVADAGAYFAGSLMGKHKLCPKISPKKTIEGAIGGLLAGVLGAVIFALIFWSIQFNNGEQIHYIPLIIMALFGGVVSIIGDLAFSAIKRSCHVKDYGSVIPGHGGILDRCDSVIFTAPFIAVFTAYFPIL